MAWDFVFTNDQQGEAGPIMVLVSIDLIPVLTVGLKRAYNEFEKIPPHESPLYARPSPTVRI